MRLEAINGVVLSDAVGVTGRPVLSMRLGGKAWC